jgi:enoyl-CoA hydratase/carnithine racemase
MELPFGQACNSEAEGFSMLFDEPSTREGMKAFIEKRKPEW